MRTHQYAIKVERSNGLYRVTVPALNLDTYVTRLGFEQRAAVDRIASTLGVPADQVEITAAEYVDMAAPDIVEAQDAMPEGLRGHLA